MLELYSVLFCEFFFPVVSFTFQLTRFFSRIPPNAIRAIDHEGEGDTLHTVLLLLLCSVLCALNFYFLSVQLDSHNVHQVHNTQDKSSE